MRLWAGGGARSRFLLVCSSRDGFHRSETTRIAALGDGLFPGKPEQGPGRGRWWCLLPKDSRGDPARTGEGLWNAWRRGWRWGWGGRRWLG